MLYPAVMSSSSIRDYRDLFSEVQAVSGVNRFDLLILRDADIDAIGLEVPPYGRMSDIVADNYDRIEEWILGQTDGLDIVIPALATYFPDVTSVDKDRRDKAVKALANTVRLALRLKKRGQDRPDTLRGVPWWPRLVLMLKKREQSNRKQMPNAIVEMVCGTILDTENGGSRIGVYGREYKLDLLCESLRLVVKEVQNNCGDDAQFALALELEPGETYVLNSVEKMKSIARRLDGKHQGYNFSDLAPYVGFNLDVAHMRIARIGGSELKEFVPKIVHAHCSDHPGIHSHDQVVGSWTNVERSRGGYRPYLNRLLDRAKLGECELPFSHSIAIELEGCNRIFSIHDSLSRLKHAIKIAQNRYRTSSSGSKSSS